MTKLNTNILSKNLLDTIRKLLDMTDFEGVDYDKDVSLFEYGFVYDSRTNVIITTHPTYVWEKTGDEVRFGMDTIKTSTILDEFSKGRELIKESTGLSNDELDGLHYTFMINEVENLNGSLKLKSIPLTLSVDELISFLENYGT